MSPMFGFGGNNGSTFLSISRNTSSHDSPSSSSTSMTVASLSASGSGSLPITPPSPDVLEKGEQPQPQLQPLQPYSRKIAVKKSGNTNDILSSRRIKTSTSPLSSQQQKRCNLLIKYGSLILLVGQMVGLVLLMRYSRIHTNGSALYLASTAVFMMEVMKFFLCIGVVFLQLNSSPKALYHEIYHHTYGSPDEMIKLTVPSFLYTVQNNLLYLALSNLDAATYQILYQLKILTTAMFSATMLGRRFSRTKWASLVVLTCGVAVVQVSGSSDGKNAASGGEEEENRNRLVGLMAVLCAACTSGFSGVYFERILKGSDVSLWIRNIQMGIPSIIIALITVYVEDSIEVTRHGFFVGYSPLVFSVITVQAVGGLIVAVVVKYADNVLKVFASSFSILLSCLISAVFFDFRPNIVFLIGACLVIVSSAMYSQPTSGSNANNVRSGGWGQSLTRERKTSLVM